MHRFERWTNQEAFLTYATQVLVPELWTGATVARDNLPTHYVNAAVSTNATAPTEAKGYAEFQLCSTQNNKYILCRCSLSNSV